MTSFTCINYTLSKQIAFFLHIWVRFPGIFEHKTRLPHCSILLMLHPLYPPPHPPHLCWRRAKLKCWQQVSPLRLSLAVTKVPLQRGREEVWQTECNLWTCLLLTVLRLKRFHCILPDPKNNHPSSSRPVHLSDSLSSSPANHVSLPYSPLHLPLSPLYLLSFIHSSFTTVTFLPHFRCTYI